MLCREIIAVCSHIHTKHINTLCGPNKRILNVKCGGTYCDHHNVKGYCHWGFALRPLIFWTQHIVSDRTGWGVIHLYNFKMHLLCIRNITWGQRHRCTGLTTLTLLCSVFKSRSMNLQDPSWLLQACAGIAPPLHLHNLYRYVHPEIFQIVWLGCMLH